MLRSPIEARGYRNINLDIRRLENREPCLLGDAHRLPFKDATLGMVVSKDNLEHFLEPWSVVKEVHRVLRAGGLSSGSPLYIPSMAMTFIGTASWGCGIY
jgi:ubiquinone/menaquinone biosynthesis C-methylase UbiE